MKKYQITLKDNETNRIMHREIILVSDDEILLKYIEDLKEYYKDYYVFNKKWLCTYKLL